MNKGIDYPKINGKEMDALRKKSFDLWKEKLATEIMIINNGELPQEKVDAMAWNCAYTIVSE